jgi:hypothetical protein
MQTSIHVDDCVIKPNAVETNVDKKITGILVWEYNIIRLLYLMLAFLIYHNFRLTLVCSFCFIIGKSPEKKYAHKLKT